MIQPIQTLSPIRQAAATGRAATRQEPDPPLPADQAEVSSTAAPAVCHKSHSLARAAGYAALGALALTTLAPLPAAAHDFFGPRHTDSIGVTVDSHRGVGVHIGSQSYDPYTGAYRRDSVHIGQGGVGVHQEWGWGTRGHRHPQTMPYPHGRHYPPVTLPAPYPGPRPVPLPNPCPPPVIYSPGPVIVLPGW